MEEEPKKEDVQNVDNDETQKTPQQKDTPPSEDLISKEDLEKLLNKARSDEKGKLYSNIEDLKKKFSAQSESMGKLNKEIEQKNKEIEDLRAGKTKVTDSLNRELRELKASHEKMKKAMEIVATEAASRLSQYKLDIYREKEIGKSGLVHLKDFVTGNNEQEIAASIASLTKKEKLIEEEAAKKAQSSLVANLPSPLSPNGAPSVTTDAIVNPQDKQKLSKLRGEEWENTYKDLLLKAKQKAGV